MQQLLNRRGLVRLGLLLVLAGCQNRTIDPGPWSKSETVATNLGSIKVTLNGNRSYLRPGDTLEVSMVMAALDAIELVRSDRPSYDLMVTAADDTPLARWSSDQPAGSVNRLAMAKNDSKTITYRWRTPSQLETQMTYVVMGVVGGNSIIYPVVVNQRGEP